MDYQVLVQQIRDALEATAGSEPDDVVLRVRAGLDAFDAFRKTSPKDVWSGGRGRYVLDSTPRFWLWGRTFCEDVLPLTKDPRVTHKEAVAAVLLQPLPSPQARSKAARGWTLSFGELKRLILMLGQNRRVPIAPVVWSLVQRGVPVNIDRSWQSLWNQLSHAWGRNGFPLNYQMRP